MIYIVDICDIVMYIVVYIVDICDIVVYIVVYIVDICDIVVYIVDICDILWTFQNFAYPISRVTIQILHITK